MADAVCITHTSCESGFCKDGVCIEPSEMGDPCRPGSCPVGLRCEPSILRCWPPSFVPGAFCKSDAECEPKRYCHHYTHTCDPRGRPGALCGPGRICLDGYECVAQYCETRCLHDNDCPKGYCRSVAGSSYKICADKDQLAAPVAATSPYGEYPLWLVGFILPLLLIFLLMILFMWNYQRRPAPSDASFSFKSFSVIPGRTS